MKTLLTLFWYYGICRANGHKRGGDAYLHCFGLLLNKSALWSAPTTAQRTSAGA